MFIGRLPWSVTPSPGEMDKIDGPYYLFPGLALLAKLPAALPVPIPNLGATNVVPVDYVAAALVELMHVPGHDGEAFHLVNPKPQPVREIYAGLAKAAGAPRPALSLPGVIAKPFVSPLPMDSAESARKVFPRSHRHACSITRQHDDGADLHLRENRCRPGRIRTGGPRVRVVLHCVVEVLARKPRSQSRTT